MAAALTVQGGGQLRAPPPCGHEWVVKFPEQFIGLLQQRWRYQVVRRPGRGDGRWLRLSVPGGNGSAEAGGPAVGGGEGEEGSSVDPDRPMHSTNTGSERLLAARGIPPDAPLLRTMLI
jgi:hypothetical protein